MLERAAKRVNRKLENRVSVEVIAACNREPLAQLLRDKVGGRLSEAIDLLKQKPDLSLPAFTAACREGRDSLSKKFGISPALIDGVRREDHWTYPEEALREGIVNALVHRDYLLSSTDIELSIYEDRLEIVSPGRLPNGITPSRMIIGCRAARNQLLKDAMRDCRYLEHMGMGIPRKIVKCMMEHNKTAPDLIEDNERFTLRLWKQSLRFFLLCNAYKC